MSNYSIQMSGLRIRAIRLQIDLIAYRQLTVALVANPIVVYDSGHPFLQSTLSGLWTQLLEAPSLPPPDPLLQVELHGQVHALDVDEIVDVGDLSRMLVGTGLMVNLASWVPSPPGKHAFQNFTI